MMTGLSAQELQNVGLTMQNGNLGNNSDLEYLWAVKAGEHAEVYFNLLSSVDPSFLRLSPVDDEIYAKFREMFPDMRVDVLNEDSMKSGEDKLKWRHFIEAFKEHVEDYNMGTIIRLDCSKGYSEDNSTFCVRIQFLAIEIARNREHLNKQMNFSRDSPYSIQDSEKNPSS